MNLILFDVDGTLVDSQHMIVAAMTRAFADLQLAPPPRAATLSVVGLSLAEAMTRLTGGTADAATVRALGEAYKSAYFDLRSAGDGEEPLYPGARAALDALAARDDVLLGLATGKSHRGIRAVLDLHDLHGRFVTVQCADDHPSKPHPAMVLAALAETGVAPDRAAIVGDTVFDVEMGTAAGILAIGVGWGYHPADRLASAGAVTVLDDYADLSPALARLFGW
ncbi:MAG: HAD-IA family hydrolase [Phyllobacteriaceae bacterium]|nr:HAD-IA family hydrolase [Phyllobacteriaceae bacterium]